MLGRLERENEGKKLMKMLTSILKMKNPGNVEKASITIEINEPITIELITRV